MLYIIVSISWGLGIGDWGLGNPQSPIPNPQIIYGKYKYKTHIIKNKNKRVVNNYYNNKY